jgi:hypothetical protein
LGEEPLFLLLAPSLVNSATEETMRQQLARLVRETNGITERVKIVGDAFEQIKIQLHSLGLIVGVPAAGAGMWTLSPFGREQLTKLKAIKRP